MSSKAHNNVDFYRNAVRDLAACEMDRVGGGGSKPGMVGDGLVGSKPGGAGDGIVALGMTPIFGSKPGTGIAP